MKGSVRGILRNILWIVSALLSVFVLTLLCTGTHSFAVQSDSMAPMLHRGDMVCVRKVDFFQLQPGDVISARFPQSDGVFTHRVVSIDSQKRQITTQGDGNLRPDPMPTDASRIIGRYWFSIPYVGFLSLYIQSYTPVYILLGVALALIVLRLALSLRKKTNG